MKTTRNRRPRTRQAWVLALAMIGSVPLLASAAPLALSADLDGDGRTDQALVDTDSGLVRVALQRSPGAFHWQAPLASGVPDVSSATAGLLTDLTHDAIALCSPLANRISILEFPTTNASVQTDAFSAEPGPGFVLALDMEGTGNTAHDDLYVQAVLGTTPVYTRETLRADGTDVLALTSEPDVGPRLRGQRIRLHPTAPFVAASVVSSGATQRIEVQDVSLPNTISNVTEITLPLTNLHFTVGFTGPVATAVFVAYEPGRTELYTLPVSQLATGVYAFSGNVITDSVPQALESAVMLAGASDARLLVLGGGTASAYRLTSGGLVQVQSFLPPLGSAFRAGGHIGGLDAMLYSGPTGSVAITAAQPFFESAGLYSAGFFQNLPAMPQGGTANVFVFEREPFVSSDPMPRGRYHHPDWSVGIDRSGLPVSMIVSSETYTGTSGGMRTPIPTDLGPAPSNSAYGLVNQYIEPVSLYSYAAAVGEDVLPLSVDPPAGRYDFAVRVSISPTDPTVDIRYRLDGDAWRSYTNPIPIFEDATLYYFAQATGSAQRGEIAAADYDFAREVDEMDRDGDGVPDYVEAGVGLDFTDSNSDADGDSFVDLFELIVGSDPNDDTDAPSNAAPLELSVAFDWIVTPRPIDGTIPGAALATSGQVLRVYDLQGNLLDSAETETLTTPGVTNPAAALIDLFVDTRKRFLVATTDEHFDINTTNADTRIGRELVGLSTAPYGATSLVVPYAFGGGDLGTEATNWIVAAQSTTGNTERVTQKDDLDFTDTLVTLLVEKKIESILHARGLDMSNDVSILPFRTASIGRYAPSTAELDELRYRIDAALPGYRIETFAPSLDDALRNGTTGANLLQTAESVYAISSRLNNDNPGSYPAPLEVIRDLLETGSLHSNYMAASTLSSTQITHAATECAALMDLLSGRPTTNVVLEIAANTLGIDCTTLPATDGLSTQSLIYANGIAYNFPEAFSMPTGTVVSVFGYSDADGGGCGGSALEVISVGIASFPAPSVSDANGNLLPDAWEALFGGALGIDPFGDLDGDGYSNLQEYFDGTDPEDPTSNSGTPVDLTPPAIAIDDGEAPAPRAARFGSPPVGFADLEWNYPMPYAGLISFEVYISTTIPDDPFADTSITVAHDGNGNFSATVPISDTYRVFVRLLLSLP